MPEVEPRFQPGDELLDLFCCAGGASEGYARAGFKVTGVDIDPQPNYPFDFIQADALEILRDSAFLERFAALAASPPCQARTSMNYRRRGDGGRADQHINLIPETRLALLASGKPYVLENVTGARSDLHDPILLHGWMFHLGVNRPRLFESNVELRPVPRADRHPASVGVYGKLDGRRLWTRNDGTELRCARTLEEGQDAMGIDWMTWKELTESIPPAYTEWIGNRMMGVPDAGG